MCFFFKLYIVTLNKHVLSIFPVDVPSPVPRAESHELQSEGLPSPESHPQNRIALFGSYEARLFLGECPFLWYQWNEVILNSTVL